MDFNSSIPVDRTGGFLLEMMSRDAVQLATPANVAWFLLGIFGVLQLMKIRETNGSKVKVITEGYSNFFASYLSAHHFLFNAGSVLRSSYEKYDKATFKIPGVERWTTVINKLDLIEDVRKAPDDKVSFSEAVLEQFVTKYTFGEQMARDHYHAHIVQNQLTRSLTTKFDDICDEIAVAFGELIPKAEKEGDWVAIPALRTMQQVVCRASNRLFVGLPLCRDLDYIDLNIEFTIETMNNALFITKFPPFLHPIVGNLVATNKRSIRRALKHLTPILSERMRMYDETGGEWPDKPVDMISWLLDEAPPNERRSVHELTRRMLLINFAAIHTSSSSFTHALYHLAAEPGYIAPIREEVERVIQEDGWTKVGMTKMWKLDSFLKESQRLNGINMVSLNRKVMSDFTLSDGTFLPKGTFLTANLLATHTDPTNYPDPTAFKPFRFSDMREQSASEALKHQMVNTSADYLSFGHGRHACPGRFFAVNELKAMMAWMVLNYDIKAEVEGVRPSNVYKSTRLSPNPTAKVLLRKRVSAV